LLEREHEAESQKIKALERSLSTCERLRVLAQAEVDTLKDQAVVLRLRAEKAEAYRNKHVLNAIQRICPDCGDDMCGPDHKTCYKCRLAAAKAESDTLKDDAVVLRLRAENAEYLCRQFLMGL
jgi:hypothetical protein